MLKIKYLVRVSLVEVGDKKLEDGECIVGPTDIEEELKEELIDLNFYMDKNYKNFTRPFASHFARFLTSLVGYSEYNINSSINDFIKNRVGGIEKLKKSLNS